MREAVRAAEKGFLTLTKRYEKVPVPSESDSWDQWSLLENRRDSSLKMQPVLRRAEQKDGEIRILSGLTKSQN